MESLRFLGKLTADREFVGIYIDLNMSLSNLMSSEDTQLRPSANSNAMEHE